MKIIIILSPEESSEDACTLYTEKGTELTKWKNINSVEIKYDYKLTILYDTNKIIACGPSYFMMFLHYNMKKTFENKALTSIIGEKNVILTLIEIIVRNYKIIYEKHIGMISHIRENIDDWNVDDPFAFSENMLDFDNFIISLDTNIILELPY